MPLPLVPVVLIGVGVASGVSGGALFLKGSLDLKRANSRIRAAGDRYEETRLDLDAHERTTNDALVVLGRHQEDAVKAIAGRMVAFLRAHEKQVAESEKLLADGLDWSPGQVSLEAGLDQDAVAWARGFIAAAATGVGINAGIPAVVTAFASASTGTAISALSGAAATNATLAFLGGGSLAMNGGGMAVGAAALNIVAIGPAILVSGLMVAGQGQKAATRALANEATLKTAIAEMQVTRVGFDAIKARTHELGDVLGRLVDRASSALDLLESEVFDPSAHASRFHDAMTLTRAVCDVATTPVVDDSGELNQDAASYAVKYRALLKDVEHD